MMTEKELERAVEELLAQVCGSPRALSDQADLLDEGLLDSMGVIELLEGLEDLGVVLQPTRLPKDLFRRRADIVEACRKVYFSSQTL